jgi:hypothetical protein
VLAAFAARSTTSFGARERLGGHADRTPEVEAETVTTDQR